MPTDFIATYDNALSPEFCKHLLEKFERSDQKYPGMTGQGYNPYAKQSHDIMLNAHPEWADELAYIEEVTARHLVHYMRAHKFMMTGALTLTIQEPQTGQPIAITNEVLDILDDSLVEGLMMKMYRFGTVNLQKYEQEKGGYFHYHSEIYPQANEAKREALHRVLLYMYYLNDVAEGGETEFHYQERMLKPKQGQLVIAPSGFTHTHKGHIPRSNDKYILTSWVLFQYAETLYGYSFK